MPKFVESSQSKINFSYSQVIKLSRDYYKIPNYYDCKIHTSYLLGGRHFAGLEFFTTYTEGRSEEYRSIIISQNEITIALRDFAEVGEDYHLFIKDQHLKEPEALRTFDLIKRDYKVVDSSPIVEKKRSWWDKLLGRN